MLQGEDARRPCRLRQAHVREGSLGPLGQGARRLGLGGGRSQEEGRHGFPRGTRSRAHGLSGVVFEVSVAMVARDPVDPDEATEFATRLLLAGIERLPPKP